MLANHSLLITDIQNLSIDDGNGLRTTVFLKGCPLRCPWCCNPETQSSAIEYFTFPSKCNDYQGSKFCGKCTGIDDLQQPCLFNAKKLIGEWLTIDQVKAKVDEGGYRKVTFSGGEPLLQADALYPLLIELKRTGYEIAFETSLSVNAPQILMSLVDEWIVDLKLQKPYYSFVPLYKVPNARYRLVIFSELFKDERWVIELIKQLHDLGITNIELLNYHTLGRSKYQYLHRYFHEFSPPTRNEIKIVMSALAKAKIYSKNLYI
ncbi:4Fe-4S cluster-binding domain-containing protein [Phocaeicola sp.]